MTIKKLSQDRSLNSKVAQDRIGKKIDSIIDVLNKRTNTIIAKRTDINLSQSGELLIPFVEGYNAENTSPRELIIMLSRDNTYSSATSPETRATTTIYFNGDFADGAPAEFTTAEIVGVSSIFNSGPQSYATFDDWLDAVIALFEAADYDVLDNRPSENSLLLTAPAGTGDVFNGLQIRIKDENDNNFLDPTPSEAFSGGISPTNITEMYFDLGGEHLTFISSVTFLDILSRLEYNTKKGASLIVGDSTGYPIFKTTGEYKINSVVGTGSDFYVDLFLIGTKI